MPPALDRPSKCCYFVDKAAAAYAAPAFQYFRSILHRISSLHRIWDRASTALMIIGLLVFNVFLNQIVGLFATSTEMGKIAQIAFRSISFSFIFIGANTIIMVAFQSVGRYIPSLLITSFRVLVLAIPAAWILGKAFGLDAIWLAFAVGEGLCCAIFSPVAYKIFHSVWHTDN